MVVGFTTGGVAPILIVVLSETLKGTDPDVPGVVRSATGTRVTTGGTAGRVVVVVGAGEAAGRVVVVVAAGEAAGRVVVVVGAGEAAGRVVLVVGAGSVVPTSGLPGSGAIVRTSETSRAALAPSRGRSRSVVAVGARSIALVDKGVDGVCPNATRIVGAVRMPVDPSS